MNFPNFHTATGTTMKMLLDPDEVSREELSRLWRGFLLQVPYGPWRWQLLVHLIRSNPTPAVPVDYSRLLDYLLKLGGFVHSIYGQIAEAEGDTKAVSGQIGRKGGPALRGALNAMETLYLQARDQTADVWLPAGILAILDCHTISLSIGQCGFSQMAAVYKYATENLEPLGATERTIIHSALYGPGGPGPGMNLSNMTMRPAAEVEGSTVEDPRTEMVLLRAFAGRFANVQFLNIEETKERNFDGQPLFPSRPGHLELYTLSVTQMPGSPLALAVSDSWLLDLLNQNPDDAMDDYPIGPKSIEGLELQLQKAEQYGLLDPCGPIGVQQLLIPFANQDPEFSDVQEDICAHETKALQSVKMTAVASLLGGKKTGLTEDLGVTGNAAEGLINVVSATRFAVNRYIALRRFLALTSIVQQPFLCTIFGGVAMQANPYSVGELADEHEVPIYSTLTGTGKQSGLTAERKRLGGRVLLDDRLTALDGQVLEYDMEEISPYYMRMPSVNPQVLTRVKQLWRIEQLARQTMVIDESRRPGGEKVEYVDIAVSSSPPIKLPLGTMSSFVGFPESGKSRMAHKFVAEIRNQVKARGGQSNVAYCMIEEPYQPQPMAEDPAVAEMLKDVDHYKRLPIAGVWPDAIRLMCDHLQHSVFRMEISETSKDHLAVIIDGGTPAFGYTVEGVEPATTTGGVRMIIRQYCSALSFIAHRQLSLFVLFTMPRLRGDIQDAYYQAVSGGSTNTFLVAPGGTVGRMRLRWNTGPNRGGSIPMSLVFDPLSRYNSLQSFDKPVPDQRTEKMFDNGEPFKE